MNRLLNIGFQHAGYWVVETDRPRPVLESHSESSNILYAFISEGEVKYIGKTTQPLKVRMNGYINPSATQTTNIRNKENILALLKHGVSIDIFVLPDNGLLHYGDFHVNLAAGLEDSLIASLAPDWNGKPSKWKENISPRRNSGSENIAFAESPLNNITFKQKLEKTYYKTGFFNVKVEFSDMFGSNGEQIEIHTGDKGAPILGYINRTANTNQTPRVMGGSELRNWFHLNCNELDTVEITVNSPVSITISIESC